RVGAHENSSATGDLDVTEDLMILGAGADHTVIDGGGIDRVLHVARSGGASLQIQGITVRHGSSRPLPNVDPGQGGGILAFGPLTVVACLITGNQATDGVGIDAASLTIRAST